MPEVKVKVTPKQYGTLWHPNIYSPSKFGIPSLKQYTIYALLTILLRLGSEVKVTVTQKQYVHTMQWDVGCAAGCAYLIGLQVALEAVEYADVQFCL